MDLFQPDRCLIFAPVDGEPALTSGDVSLLDLLPRSLNILKKLRVVIQANAERPVVMFD